MVAFSIAISVFQGVRVLLVVPCTFWRNPPDNSLARCAWPGPTLTLLPPRWAQQSLEKMMSQMKRWPFGGRKGSFNLSWFHRFEYIKLGGYPKAFQSSTAIFACNLVGKKCLDALFEAPYSSRESTTLADCSWHSPFL